MNTRIKFSKLVIVLLVTLSALGISTSAALADRPVQYDWTWTGSSEVSGVCPFSFNVTYTQNASESDFYDRNGVITHAVINVVEQDTFSNAGKTLVSLPFSYNFIYFWDENGNVTHGYNVGVTEKIPLPDGRLFISAGRFDWLDHPGAIIVLSPDHGNPGDLDAFCAALAP